MKLRKIKLNESKRKEIIETETGEDPIHRTKKANLHSLKKLIKFITDSKTDQGKNRGGIVNTQIEFI